VLESIEQSLDGVVEVAFAPVWWMQIDFDSKWPSERL
jgi:hypothetical protein